MHYENFLFTRNQRQDFKAFVRPSLLTNKDVSAIGAIFNYVTDISRLTAAFPSLYAFPLGEYILLLRHYNSGRQHAGRAIGVIEGIAVKQADASAFSAALPQFIAQQADLLNVSASIADIEEHDTESSAEHEWNGASVHTEAEDFVSEFVDLRSTDRLFLPFTDAGRATLINVLADQRLSPPLYFAFGTNSDVLAQLERQARIDIASFFKTDRASFRNRQNNRVSSFIGAEVEVAPEPSMSLRPVAPPATQLRRETEADEENDVDTRVGSRAMSVRQSRSEKHAENRSKQATSLEDDNGEQTVLTMRQLRDQKRAEEAAAMEPESAAPHSANPIRRFIDFVGFTRLAFEIRVRIIMAAWIKITRPNVEVGGNFVIYQALIIDLERATGFAMQNPTNLAFFVDGKTFVVQQQLDAKAFQSVMAYAQKVTGQSLT